MSDIHPHYDIVIAGAGPAGLAFARSMTGAGLRMLLVDPLPVEVLRAPDFDGREIALTHRSMAILRGIGVWDRLDAADISDLREAHVTNGAQSSPLRFSSGGRRRLGALVSNHLIRRHLFHLVERQSDLTLCAGRRLVQARIRSGGERRPGRVDLGLEDGAQVTARLVIAADSRLSTLRAQLGVHADIQVTGRTLIVCRVRHERDHRHVATECFDHDQTLAFLPLNPDAQGHRSSVVLTLKAAEAAALSDASDVAFEQELSRRVRGRLGRMEVVSPRRLYPLTVAWSRRFAGEGFALIGDAAVGMNPMTAHGFNLGLRGQARLAQVVRQAHRDGRWIGSEDVLSAYDVSHRRDALPLYAGANAIARLFSAEHPAALAARQAVLGVARNLSPFQHAVERLLMDCG